MKSLTLVALLLTSTAAVASENQYQMSFNCTGPSLNVAGDIALSRTIIRNPRSHRNSEQIDTTGRAIINGDLNNPLKAASITREGQLALVEFQTSIRRRVPRPSTPHEMPGSDYRNLVTSSLKLYINTESPEASTYVRRATGLSSTGAIDCSIE